MHQPAHDLFGEIPVLQSEIRDWVASTSPIHLEARGYDLYVQRYAVAEKVRASKARGDFDVMVQRRPPLARV